MITVRDARDDDAEALAALLAELGYPVAAGEVPARVARFQSRGNGRVLIAEVEGQIAAFAALELTFPIHHAAPVAHLSAFAVAARARRQGIGRALLAHVQDAAHAAGCLRLVVTSADHRADAHAFYLAAGWRAYGRKFTTELR
jgi:GNAT superfamily N-acetyltransferase